MEKRGSHVMTNHDDPLPSPKTSVRRRLFSDDQPQRSADDDDALVVAREIERRTLSEKSERWRFDFVNGTPLVEGCWRLDSVILQPLAVILDDEDCSTTNIDCKTLINYI